MHSSTASRRRGAALAGLVVSSLVAIGLAAAWVAPAVPTEAGSDGAVTADDGVLPEGAGAFDEHLPGIARLDDGLRAALQAAAAEAATEGVRLVVNSGWRSAELQQRLLDDAVAEHGSAQEAARWVATADSSAHVTGDAVDVGPPAAAAWLADHGAQHGLCRTYGNEPWHFELRPEAVGAGCPPPFDDPTDDPRMR